MRSILLIAAALAAFAAPATVSAQTGTRPLDRIYGPARPGDAQPVRPSMSPSPATRATPTQRSDKPGGRPLDRIYGSSSTAGRGGGLGGGTTVGRPQGGSSLGAGSVRPSTGATRKPAGPAYRGGTVGTRPRFSNSPTLSRPRR